MLPGFGVGGYCLTKDSLLADWSLNSLFDGKAHLDMSLNAIKINDLMPKYTLKLLQNEFNDIKNLNIAILGISYLNDVADTRYSPAELFYDECVNQGANIYLHDPIVKYWEEKNMEINQDLLYMKDQKIDIVVLTVRHKEYLELNAYSLINIFFDVKIIIDGFNIVSDSDAKILAEAGIKVIGIGKGHWEKYNKRNINE
jgi:UDP-N-acetyl-D-mannosaminuronate dehydrogenase